MNDSARLADALEAWAQNEEMVDAHYTQHGKDCNAAAAALRSAERGESLVQIPAGYTAIDTTELEAMRTAITRAEAANKALVEQTLERAAKVCDERIGAVGSDDEAENEPLLCAARIRALRSQP